MKKEYFSNFPKETEQIAAEIAATLIGGEVIAFIGNLGMGKTCFTRGLAAGLGFTGEVNSPTFALVNEYVGGRLPLYHFDMYRVSGWEDLYTTGFFEYLSSGGVLAVEWSENISAALPEDTIYIEISQTDEEGRKITVTRGEAN